jgi:hypothetical protein
MSPANRAKSSDLFASSQKSWQVACDAIDPVARRDNACHFRRIRPSSASLSIPERFAHSAGALNACRIHDYNDLFLF